MPLRELTVSGYRSIRALRLPLGGVNVLTGPNGCGKSNLYNALFLLARAASGDLARTLAAEGGMPSALWAGARGPGAVRMTIGATLDDFAYELACGLPTPNQTPSQPNENYFKLDPMVKEESVRLAGRLTEVEMLKRTKSSAWVRNAEGKRVRYPLALSPSESVLAQIREPHRYPELSLLRDELLRWRFYHHFRTDPDAPMRQAQVGVSTYLLAHDGSDLAAALQTILFIGDSERLKHAVGRAFPGARLSSTAGGPWSTCVDEGSALFEVRLHSPALARPLKARELSDGQLRYLGLLAALLSPHPPSLIALNEPETSLHPDLLEPLGELIADTARRTQLWITTHSQALAGFIARSAGCKPVQLEMVDGATRIVGQKLLATGEDLS
ncbi:MAG: AAA family ATPase [Planctomycetota bacterium]|nr:AAA family ATPase [Planctomycetota bacterium]